MRANFGRPLSGIRIVDLTSLLPGGLATRLLADLGAEVVKVEPKGGETGRHFPPLDDGLSVYYRLTAGGKKVRFVDLKAPGGRSALAGLVKRADGLMYDAKRAGRDRLWFALAREAVGDERHGDVAGRLFRIPAELLLLPQIPQVGRDDERRFLRLLFHHSPQQRS